MRFVSVVVLGFPCFWLSATTLQAIPILSIDLDRATAGIQSTLAVQPGAPFTIDVVYTGDGVATFDTVILDVAFNDAGSILALGAGLTPGAPTAGTLAGTAPLLALDVFGGAPVAPGGALTPDFIPIAPGFSGGMGGVGLLSAGLPFPTVGAGTSIDMFSLTFSAAASGTSTISALGFPPGAGLELALAGSPVPTALATGSVSVSAVPEPGTMLLLGSGVAALAACRRRGKVSV